MLKNKNPYNLENLLIYGALLATILFSESSVFTAHYTDSSTQFDKDLAISVEPTFSMN